jgi:CubicO group peptidase (beta-lactamase class C family)
MLRVSLRSAHDELLKNGTPCQQAFMRQAIAQQAINRGKVGQAHRGYGYQTWITTDGPGDSYWWLGYGGQRVAVDPEKKEFWWSPASESPTWTK